MGQLFTIGAPPTSKSTFIRAPLSGRRVARSRWSPATAATTSPAGATYPAEFLNYNAKSDLAQRKMCADVAKIHGITVDDTKSWNKDKTRAWTACHQDAVRIQHVRVPRASAPAAAPGGRVVRSHKARYHTTPCEQRPRARESEPLPA
ncbi:hypothetical protein B0T18DRAFT_394132 [Schizothecium vesticola]|uniref:Uncharacterized protein n=1 Tax=Schizothecium vesticola TaxID=314040 RepID=A0AA40K0L6_9PEZI|nr:hypothetical protein B0T18DRAFT_394132 [Schizothecium vesticola]